MSDLATPNLPSRDFERTSQFYRSLGFTEVWRDVQELMRHAKVSTTMEVYAQAGMEKKRVAQRRAVDVLLDRKPKNSTMEQAETKWSRIAPARPRMLPEVAV